MHDLSVYFGALNSKCILQTVYIFLRELNCSLDRSHMSPVSLAVTTIISLASFVYLRGKNACWSKQGIVRRILYVRDIYTQSLYPGDQLRIAI